VPGPRIANIPFLKSDENNNSRPEGNDFNTIADIVLSRRDVVGNGFAFGLATFVIGLSETTASLTDTAKPLDFIPVEANSLDTVTLPKGYSWQVVTSWGDPLWSTGVDFDDVTRGTGASQELAFGDNNDGMSLFFEDGKTILAANNEYVNRKIIYGNRASGRPETLDDVRKGKAGHGISICEIKHLDGTWKIVRDSPYNRRITADTPMEITGPARGHSLLQTPADPSGTRALGTWNNCGNGRTPWGTYLACEENFNGYFSSSDENYMPTPEMKRYGIGNKDWGYGWARADVRFDISKYPNEPNRAGFVVEIDPLDPSSTPKKRTGLGRLKHENAEVVVAANGRVVVYMGDDEKGEFLYKFISAGKFVEGGDNSDLLDNGMLFVAKFKDDGTGDWVELTPESTGMKSMAEICIFTRQAASAVGATTMDRPEWVTANPKKADVYCALTNNTNRGKGPNKGGDDMPVAGPNPREGNKYGQIVRWTPNSDDHTASGFNWDLFLVAGNPGLHKDAYAGSKNITTDNMFNSPDGLAFDSNGFLWIQTDGNYSNTGDFSGMGNNQMLMANPETGKIKRFMVGPKGCEITGTCWSHDSKTMFVGIQHPGEDGNSHFPGGGNSVPRSSIIAITRNDGGPMG